MDLPYKLWAEYATLKLTFTVTSIRHSTDSNYPVARRDQTLSNVVHKILNTV